MDIKLPIDRDASMPWVEVAQGARMLRHVLNGVGDPTPKSNFAMIDAMYPPEMASTWSRSFLTAALEHLGMWADYAAPLKFHPEQEIIHTLRPAFTLARAALESAAHAVWMQAGTSERECAMRHLRLIRWDYSEHRKSLVGNESAKGRVADMDKVLLNRMKGVLTEQDLRIPSLYDVLRAAAPVVGRTPDEVEKLWRAASGAAHGKAWPALALQHVVPGEEYEPGQFRTVRIPNVDEISAVLQAAHQMTQYGVLQFAQFSGADVGSLIERSQRWLASVITPREGPACQGELRPAVHSKSAVAGRDQDQPP